MYGPNQTEWIVSDLIRKQSQAQAVGMPGVSDEELGTAIGSAHKAQLDNQRQLSIAQGELNIRNQDVQLRKEAMKNQQDSQTAQGIGSTISGINTAWQADKQLALTEKLYSGLFPGAGTQAPGVAGSGLQAALGAGGQTGLQVAGQGVSAGLGAVPGAYGAALGLEAPGAAALLGAGSTLGMGAGLAGAETAAFGGLTAGASLMGGAAGVATTGMATGLAGGATIGAGLGAGIAGGAGAAAGASIGAGAGAGMMAGIGTGLAAMGPFALIPLAMGAIYMGLQAFGVFGDKKKGGGTIVCTELYRQGFIDRKTKILDHRFGATLPLETLAGYRMLFTPVVNTMQKSRIFSNIIRIFLVPVAKDMAARMSPTRKRNRFGRIITSLLLPICEAVGWMSSKEEVLKWA